MIVSYPVRLILLCFGSFYLVHSLIGLLALRLLPMVLSASRRIHSRQAARLFLALRLTPVIFAVGIVSAFCIPSYLRYERNLAKEDVGIFCVTAATLGLILCLHSTILGIRAFVQSVVIGLRIRSSQSLEFSGTMRGVISISGDRAPGMPLLALVGILRPKLLVSPRVLKALSPEQLDAAFAHERAHQLSRDNLKRLFVELVPDIFPFVNSFKVIEDHWARFIELAADDDATLGEVERCIALAEALIRVARLGKVETTSLLLSSLSANNQELAVRVRRLLEGDCVTKSPRRFYLFPWGFSLGLLGLSVLILYRGDMLYPIYSVLELLFR